MVRRDDPGEGATFLGLGTECRQVSSSLLFWGVCLSIQCPEVMGGWKVNISTDLFSSILMDTILGNVI